MPFRQGSFCIVPIVDKVAAAVCASLRGGQQAVSIGKKSDLFVSPQRASSKVAISSSRSGFGDAFLGNMLDFAVWVKHNTARSPYLRFEIQRF